MKAGTLFWGSFLVFLGIFILLDNLNLLKMDIGEIAIYWPILLIIWGVALLKIPEILKYILSGLSGVLLALIIVSSIFSAKRAVSEFDFNEDFEFNVTDNSDLVDAISMDSLTKYVNMDISSGASSLKISSSDDKENLIKSYSDGIMIDENSDSDSVKNISISLGPIDKKNDDNFSDIRLNSIPIYEINFSSGASKIDLDFTNNKVRDFDLDAGAANVKLKFGQLMDTTRITINSGAAKIGLLIPKESNAYLDAETALTSSNFKNFKKIKSGKYEYIPSNKNGKVILIEFEGALSSFTVDTY